MKTQIIICQKSRKILTIDCTNGATHDFALYKSTDHILSPNIKVLADSGYQGIATIHENSTIPIKKQKNQDLSEDAKLFNKALSKVRVACENVFGMLKRFKIISEKFRNVRDTFKFKFSLISKLYNYELAVV